MKYDEVQIYEKNDTGTEKSNLSATVLCGDRLVDLGSVDKSLQGLPVKSKGTTTKFLTIQVGTEA